MDKGLKVEPLGFAARCADALMVPVMYAVSGTPFESPQRTHRWNNQRLRREDTRHILLTEGAFCSGCRDEIPAQGVRSHMPVLGGWRNYVVLRAWKYWGDWHVGWKTDKAVGISRIPICGPTGCVRMLVGPEDVVFFGIRPQDGRQIRVIAISMGQIGDGSKYCRVPLL